jgi:hypothetical protein
MSTIFHITMLPARQGDCLWIEYGDPGKPSRVLIDGGTPETIDVLQDRICQLPEAERKFELLVVSHIDNDHIGGTLAMLYQNIPGLEFGDIWFNGYWHLTVSGLQEFGPVQGEKLTTWLLKPGTPWNLSYNKKTVYTPDKGKLPVKDLRGGMKITILSPGKKELSRLKPKWEIECKNAGLNPQEPAELPKPVPRGLQAMGVINIDSLAAAKFKPDTSEANGSSIGFLAEFDSKRVLLTGDCYSPVLIKNIKRIIADQNQQKLPVDAIKLPHHGSKSNLSKDLLDLLDCKKYLISTNGAIFKHPDKEAVARIIRYGGSKPELIFNYKTEFNDIWENSDWMKQYDYRATYPEPGKEGITVLI